MEEDNNFKKSQLEYDLYKKDQLEWSKHTPIKVVDGVTYVYFTDDIQMPSMYNEVVHKLLNASESDVFVNVINSGGGDVESAIMIVDAIRRSEASVRSFVTGFAASAATIIALAGEDLEIVEHTPFMVHNYSAGLGGKGHELKARQEFMDKALNAAFKDFYTGFLTDDEMSEVIDGKDMWIGTANVRERWDRVKAVRGI